MNSMERRWLLPQRTFRRIAVPGVLTGGNSRWQQVRPYVVAALALAVALGLRALLVDATGTDDLPFVLFFAAVLVAAIYGGLWPGVVTVIAATILVNWLFLGSRGSFETGVGEIVACVLFLIEGIAVSVIGWQVRHNLRRLALESSRREVLADISTRALAGATSEDLVVRCRTMAGHMLDCELADVWLADPSGTIALDAIDPAHISGSEAAVIRDLISGEKATLMPTRSWADATVQPGTKIADRPISGVVALLTGPEKPFGVLAVSTHHQRAFSPGDLAFLQTAAALLSAALQRDRYTESLRRNESRLREVTDMAPMFIWIADAAGELAFFNKRLLTFTGRTLEEQVQEGWAGIVHPDDIDVFLEAFHDAVDKQEPLEFELRLLGADGKYRWFLNRAVPAPVSDGALTGYIGSSIDITDRRRAMEALRAVADLGADLSGTLNQLDVAQVLSHCMVSHGLANVALVALGGHDGHFYDATACQLGAPDDSLVKQLAQAFDDDGDEERLLLEISRLPGPAVMLSESDVASPLAGSAHVNILRQVGCAQLIGAPLSARGRTVGALALFLAAGHPAPDGPEMQLIGELAGRAALAIDNAALYAESQHQARELQRSNDALQFLANAGIEFSRLLQNEHTMQRVAEFAVPTFADIAVIDVACPDGKLERLGIAASDDRLAELMRQIRPRHGYGNGAVARELRSGHSTMISHVRPRHLRLFGEYIEDAQILGQIAPTSALFVPMTARGQVFGVLTFIRVGERPPFTSEDLLSVGEQLGRRAGLSVDNARLFAESQAREAELREANIAKDEFLGLMSHELRTPITVIDGGARILVQRGETLPAEARGEIVADVAREADRLAAMLEDLLALARIELNQRPVVEPVLLHRFIERLIEKARPAGREIRMTIAEDLAPVAAEPAYVDHVFRNLMSNADKYSPGDSVIDVTVGPGDNCVIVRVLDRGPGVAEGDAERIFERFYRSDSTARLASGAGMGLAVCKRLIETMSGEIWARPREGGGLEVGFSLPLYDEEDV